MRIIECIVQNRYQWFSLHEDYRMYCLEYISGGLSLHEDYRMYCLEQVLVVD